jgi:hypothetical protein
MGRVGIAAGEHYARFTSSHPANLLGHVLFTRLNIALYIRINIAFILVERTLWQVWMFDVGPGLLSFLVSPFTVIYQFAMLFTQIGLWLPVFSIVTGIGLGGCVVRHRVNPPALGWAERAKGKPATKNYDYATQHTFEIDDRNCWYNPVYKNWGATLSRVGRQLLVVDHKHSKEELERAINQISKT